MAIAKGAQIWVIGKETNTGWERPGDSDGNGGEVITPAQYAQCFARCRTAIKKLPSHTDDWIVPSAPAPWNPQTTYSGNSNDDWVGYFQDVLNQCVQLNAKPDALSIYTYTHGLDPSLVTISHPMDPPFQNRCFEFRAYRDFLGAIPSSLKSLPVLISETQAQFWQDSSVGWIQRRSRRLTIGIRRNQISGFKRSVRFAGRTCPVIRMAGVFQIAARSSTISEPRSRTIIACACPRNRCRRPIRSPPPPSPKRKR